MQQLGNVEVDLTSRKNDSPELGQEDRAKRVWSALAKVYTTLWLDRNGDEPSDMWVWKLSKLTDQQIARGLKRCSERVDKDGRGYMPNMPEFMNLCTYVHPADVPKQLPEPGHELREIKAAALSAGANEYELTGLDYNGIYAVLMRYRYGWKLNRRGEQVRAEA